MSYVTHTHKHADIHLYINNTWGVLQYTIYAPFMYLERIDYKGTVILLINRFIIYLESIAARERVEGEGHKDRYRDRDECNGNNGVLACLEAVVV